MKLLSDQEYEFLQDRKEKASEYCAIISDLKAENEELRKKLAITPDEDVKCLPPILFADFLINATYERKATFIEQSFFGRNVVQTPCFTIKELKEIAEYLLVHCNNNEVKKEELNYGINSKI